MLVISATIVGCSTILWGWPGLFGVLAVPPGILVGLSLAHGLDAWTGRSPLRPGFLAVGLALGTALLAGSLVGLSTVHAPREVILERRAVLRAPVEQVWAAVEEPTFWMRWDGLIGELSPIPAVATLQDEPSSGAASPRTGEAFAALLKVAGRNVPVRLTLRDLHEGRTMAWDVIWTEGSIVERFGFGIRLEPRGDETEATYEVRYRLPSFGARLANTLALESGVVEGMVESLAGLARWTQEHPDP